MIKFSSKDIMALEKWANGLSKLGYLDPLLVRSAQDTVRSLKEDLNGDSMSKDVDELNKMADKLWDRSPAPRLTPEQLNAIDLLILGKTDREVSEIVGVRRETITKWHKNPFFTADLNTKREALWEDSKLRLRALASEAVNVLTNGLHSEDEKIAISAAVHILKTVGLYDVAGKTSITLPKTPEEAVWAQALEDNTNSLKGSRPDALTEFSTRNWAEKVGAKISAQVLAIEYEKAVKEQKRELKDSKNRAKPQEDLSQHITIEEVEEDFPQGQSPEPIKA